MPKHTAPLPDWELVLSSAAHLQRILPDAVLVGGTASAIHAEHRFSRDTMPYDLEDTELSEYKNLAPQWHDWNTVKAVCAHIATVIFDRICDFEENAR